jgi:hypothetical protein
MAQLIGKETQQFRIKIIIWKPAENAPNFRRQHMRGEVK